VEEKAQDIYFRQANEEEVICSFSNFLGLLKRKEERSRRRGRDDQFSNLRNFTWNLT
jgi:hypothetical protein